MEKKRRKNNIFIMLIIQFSMQKKKKQVTEKVRSFSNLCVKTNNLPFRKFQLTSKKIFFHSKYFIFDES